MPDDAVTMQHLTRATATSRPAVCRGCDWWQRRAGARALDRERWADDVEERFGAWGKVYLEGARHVGSLQYGPADAFARAAALPAGPPSPDAVLVTCAYLSDRSSPWALQSLFLACLGECRDNARDAVEAFAYRYPAGEEFAGRFLTHRTIFPRDFLADLGFATLRVAGAVELMRLDLRGLVPVREPESAVAAAWRRARERLASPAPAAS